MNEAIVASISSLAGIVTGIVLGEYFRRRSRIEFYSQKIFDKRLKVYEKLMLLVQGNYNHAVEIIENTQLSKKDRRSIISKSVLSIAKYVDDNSLYIDIYIGAQAIAFLMGVEDIQDIKDALEREAAISKFQNDYKNTKSVIVDESGISEINKHFKSLSKSNPNTALIKYMKERRKYGI